MMPRLIGGALALLLAPLPTKASPHEKFWCGVWDVHITTLIEDHGALQDTSSIAIAKASYQQQEARAHCAAGRFAQAFYIYERIDLASEGNVTQ